MTSTIKVDTISEYTSANGVAIDSVTLKDGNVGAAGTATSVAGIPFFQGDTGSIYTHDVSGTDDTAQYNTAYGLNALDAITTGDRNTTVGNQAGSALTTASDCAFFGRQAGVSNTTGSNNTFLGSDSGATVTTGTRNTFVGAAGWQFDAENDNTGIGHNALAGVINGGEYNVAIGNYSLDALTTADQNTVVGYQSGSAVTTGGSNAFLGYQTGLANTTGYDNVFIGNKAGLANTTGHGVIAIGQTAYDAADTEVDNLAIGRDALGGAVAGGEYNVAVGNYTLDALTSADYNVAVGYQALTSLTTGGGGGGRNVSLGYSAASALSTGYDNIAIGAKAAGAESDGIGTNVTTGERNICIGSFANTNATGAAYQYVMGYAVAAGEDNQFIFGKPSNTVANEFDTDNAWTQSSDVRKKKNIKDAVLGLDFINDLRPVTYEWKPNNEFPKDFSEYSEENHMTLNVTMHGMIAQEVKAALDKTGVDRFGGWQEDDDGCQRLSKEMFVFPLIKAVQELSAQVTTLQEEIKALKEEK